MARVVAVRHIQHKRRHRPSEHKTTAACLCCKTQTTAQKETVCGGCRGARLSARLQTRTLEHRSYTTSTSVPCPRQHSAWTCWNKAPLCQNEAPLCLKARHRLTLQSCCYEVACRAHGRRAASPLSPPHCCRPRPTPTGARPAPLPVGTDAAHRRLTPLRCACEAVATSSLRCAAASAAGLYCHCCVNAAVETHCSEPPGGPHCACQGHGRPVRHFLAHPCCTVAAGTPPVGYCHCGPLRTRGSWMPAAHVALALAAAANARNGALLRSAVTMRGVPRSAVLPSPSPVHALVSRGLCRGSS